MVTNLSNSRICELNYQKFKINWFINKIFPCYFLGIVQNPNSNVRTAPLSQLPFKELVSYDTEVHLIKREEWIKPVWKHPDSVTALDERNQISGYAGVFHCPRRKYTQLKPLLADSPEVAAMLLYEIMKVVPEDHMLKVKIPSENPHAISLMKTIGFSTDIKPPDTIMFSKHQFKVEMNKVYSAVNGNNVFA